MKNYSFEPFYKERSRFYNPHCENAKRTIKDVVLWQTGYYNDRRAPKKMPDDFQYPNSKRKVKAENPQVTWINHSSFHVEVDGLHMLTDPIWSERCSPFSFFGPMRKHPSPLDLKKLSPVDVILISHNHYDHLDQKSVRELISHSSDALWIVPLGLKKWMERQGVKRCIELAWWEEITLEAEGKPSLKLKVTAVPAQHFSGRTLFDKNQTLWAGYVVRFMRGKRKSKQLYFVGDTGYNRKDFKAIGKTLGPMDLSLIPIGTYTPARFMDPVHISPAKATKIHEEVQSKLSLGMHWKTFRLSSEELRRPPFDLFCAMEKAGLDPKAFRVLDPGQTINW